MTPRRNVSDSTRQRPPEHPSGDDRYSAIDRAYKISGAGPDSLLEVLSVAQGTFGFLSEELLIYVSQLVGVPLSQVYGVATFYQLFTFETQGDNSCIVCTGTACHVKGADAILNEISETFSVPVGGTTEDDSLSLTVARCLGRCGLAPVVVLNGEVLSKQEPATMIPRVEKILADQEDKVTA